MEYLKYIIVGVIIFFGIRGRSKGLLMTIVDFVSWIISALGAFVLSPILAGIIRGTQFFNEMVISIGTNLNIGEMANSGQRALIESFNLPSNLENFLLSNNNPDFYAQNGLSSVDQYVAFVIASLIIGIFSFIVVVIIIRICVGLVKGILGVFKKLPIIKTFDKFGGLLVGLFKGLLISWIIMLGVFIFIDTDDYERYTDTINDSAVLTFVNTTNIFSDFFLR